MMNQICKAIASETAILDALAPHYDLQSIVREFEWAMMMAKTYGEPKQIRWETVFEFPKQFPIDTDRGLISRDLQMYVMILAQKEQRHPAIATLFAAALLRAFTPGRHDYSSQWVAVFMTQARSLDTPVVLAATQFIAWYFLATESTAELAPDLTLAIAIGLGHLTGRVARHFRDAASDLRNFCLDPKIEFPMWRAAIDDVLTYGNGVDESLWYAREALHMPNTDKRQ